MIMPNTNTQSSYASSTQSMCESNKQIKVNEGNELCTGCFQITESIATCANKYGWSLTPSDSWIFFYQRYQGNCANSNLMKGLTCCLNPSSSECTTECTTKFNCGTDGYFGDSYCKSEENRVSIYQNFKVWECNSGKCSYTTEEIPTTICSPHAGTPSQLCYDICGLGCVFDSDCNEDEWTGEPYCKDDDVYQMFRTYTCNYEGHAGSICETQDKETKKTDCPDICKDGICVSTESDNGNEEDNTSNWFKEELIGGFPNWMLLIGGFILLMVMMNLGGKRRRR